MLTIGSLFSGIGGLELGLEWAGLGPVVWQVEQDAWCRGVLAMHWPNTDRGVIDVQKAGAENLAAVDLICGGFPCQDVSVAGNGEGLDGARSGLWRDFARIVGELRPRVVVVENVSALVARGLDRVTADLRGEGYRVHGRIIRASDVGAPHRRERLFLVALADANGGRREGERIAQPRGECGARGDLADGHGASRQLEHESRVVDAVRARPQGGSDGPHEGRAGSHDGRAEMADDHGGAIRLTEQRLPTRRSRGVCDEGIAQPGGNERTRGRPPESGVDRSSDGVPDRVDRWPSRPGDAPTVWEPARTIDVRSPVWGARLRALGNAVVPQCAEVVGRRIIEILSGAE